MKVLLRNLGFLLGVWVLFMGQVSRAQAPSNLQWSVSGPSAGAEAAILGGRCSGGKQHGDSQFMVTCQHRRIGCMDCGEMANQIEAVYQFSWIIRPVPAFYFEPFRLGGGAQQDLATLGVDPNPPTPRHLSASVRIDLMWRIDIPAKPEDIAALKEGGTSKTKMTLVLHSFDEYGLPAITMTNTIPPVGPAFQAVLNACSNNQYRGQDATMCEPRAGKALIEVKVCWGLVPRHCEIPEPSKGGAIWHLTTFGSDVPEKGRHYRLWCGYKDKGAADVMTEARDSGLSSRLKECDETLEPLSVSCK